VTTTIAVSVVWATPDVQDIVPLTLPTGATVGEAIARSLLAEHYRIDLREMRLAIRGRLVRDGTVLADGDRVEICRALRADPKDARRTRARARTG